METINLIQESEAWHQFRAWPNKNASDAPAMMGVSPYKTRAQLLREKATGIVPEVDAATQHRFDSGHRFETLARPLAEDIIGEELYPVIGSKNGYSASFDGLTMLEDIGFEHKSLNAELRSLMAEELFESTDLPMHYQVQMEQQLMVSNAKRVLFMASEWDVNDSLIEERHCWYSSDMKLRQQIIDAWAQFERDVAEYQHRVIKEPPKAEPIKELPTVTVQVRGELTLCNIRDVTPLFDKFLAEAKTTLATDEDFAQAEAEARLGRETARRCKLTAKAVVDQMLSISEVTRTLEEYAAKFDTLALKQEKAVKEQKEARKTAAKIERDKAYAEHIAALNAEIKPVTLVLNAADKPDFVDAMKNQRTLESLYNKLDTELSRAKIAAEGAAKNIHKKLAWYKVNVEGYGFLFADLQSIITGNDIEAFQAIVTGRIDAHKKAEIEILKTEHARIKAEENAPQAKVEAATTVITDADHEASSEYERGYRAGYEAGYEAALNDPYLDQKRHAAKAASCVQRQ